MPWIYEKMKCRRGGRINRYPFLVILPFSIETIPIAHALSANRSAVSKSIATSFIAALVKNSIRRNVARCRVINCTPADWEEYVGELPAPWSPLLRLPRSGEAVFDQAANRFA